jgi:hypothetical protein
VIAGALALAAAFAALGAPKGPQVLTSDVERFYRVY